MAAGAVSVDIIFALMPLVEHCNERMHSDPLLTETMVHTSELLPPSLPGAICESIERALSLRSASLRSAILNHRCTPQVIPTGDSKQVREVSSFTCSDTPLEPKSPVKTTRTQSGNTVMTTTIRVDSTWVDFDTILESGLTNPPHRMWVTMAVVPIAIIMSYRKRGWKPYSCTIGSLVTDNLRRGFRPSEGHPGHPR